MENIIIIPARMESKRFPGKPLKEVQGKSLLQYTYEKAKQSKADRVWVTSPNKEINFYCAAKSIPFISTSSNCISGTQRCAEAVDNTVYSYPKIGTVINLQVDEPCIKVDDLNRLMPKEGLDSITTLVGPAAVDHLDDENIVKVVISNGRCHWFSRYYMGSIYQHVGVYAFPINILKRITNLVETDLSKDQNLEQLTWIEHGHPIRPIVIRNVPLSINTSEDWDEFIENKQLELIENGSTANTNKTN